MKVYLLSSALLVVIVVAGCSPRGPADRADIAPESGVDSGTGPGVDAGGASADANGNDASLCLGPVPKCGQESQALFLPCTLRDALNYYGCDQSHVFWYQCGPYTEVWLQLLDAHDGIYYNSDGSLEAYVGVPEGGFNCFGPADFAPPPEGTCTQISVDAGVCRDAAPD